MPRNSKIQKQELTNILVLNTKLYEALFTSTINLGLQLNHAFIFPQHSICILDLNQQDSKLAGPKTANVLARAMLSS